MKQKTTHQANYDTRYYKDYATTKKIKEYWIHIMVPLLEQTNTETTKKTISDKIKKKK